MAQAMFMSAQVLGNLLGSALSGYVAEHYGYDPMYWISGALAVIGLGIFIWQQRGARSLTLPEE
jgi:predicted MFS family arabinose efflux permease